ncbi:universal stress protein [Pontibacter diazotrophicus]|nr:universal stress protein [Pontibacter diazotrophicus]
MKTILCITDFSQCSENAAKYAYELAQFLNARLLLFHNISNSAAAVQAPSEDDCHSQLVTQLEDRNGYINKLEAVRRRIAYNSANQVSCESLVKHGEAKENIPALIQEEKVDLVVIGNEAADALRDIFSGTVAAHVIEKSTCPVLVVPQQAAFKPFRQIVFAVDKTGEPYQDTGLVHRLVQLFDAEVHALHVLPKERASASAVAEEEIFPLKAWNTYKLVNYHIILHNSIEQGISQFTRERRADMLVLGYHAENPWQHLRNVDAFQEKAYHTYLPVLFAHYKRQNQK